MTSFWRCHSGSYTVTYESNKPVQVNFQKTDKEVSDSGEV